MSELSPEARELVDDGLSVLRPSSRDRARVTSAAPCSVSAGWAGITTWTTWSSAVYRSANAAAHSTARSAVSERSVPTITRPIPAPPLLPLPPTMTGASSQTARRARTGGRTTVAGDASPRGPYTAAVRRGSSVAEQPPRKRPSVVRVHGVAPMPS